MCSRVLGFLNENPSRRGDALFKTTSASVLRITGRPQRGRGHRFPVRAESTWKAPAAVGSGVRRPGAGWGGRDGVAGPFQ